LLKKSVSHCGQVGGVISLNPADSAGETAMMGVQETPARLFL
jgi:hypothetical protein